MGQYQVFLENQHPFFRKNDKNKKKYFACFTGKMEAKPPTFLYQNDQKKSLSAVKISSNLKKLSVMAGDSWWTHPYIYIILRAIQK